MIHEVRRITTYNIFYDKVFVGIIRILKKNEEEEKRLKERNFIVKIAVVRFTSPPII